MNQLSRADAENQNYPHGGSFMVYDEDGNLTATELVGDMDEDGDLDTVDNTAIYCAADPQCDFGTL